MNKTFQFSVSAADVENKLILRKSSLKTCITTIIQRSKYIKCNTNYEGNMAQNLKNHQCMKNNGFACKLKSYWLICPWILIGSEGFDIAAMSSTYKSQQLRVILLQSLDINPAQTCWIYSLPTNKWWVNEAEIFRRKRCQLQSHLDSWRPKCSYKQSDKWSEIGAQVQVSDGNEAGWRSSAGKSILAESYLLCLFISCH